MHCSRCCRGMSAVHASFRMLSLDSPLSCSPLPPTISPHPCFPTLPCPAPLHQHPVSPAEAKIAALDAKLSPARTAFSDARTKLNELESELSDIDKKLVGSYGEDDVFVALVDRCFEAKVRQPACCGGLLLLGRRGLLRWVLGAGCWVRCSGFELRGESFQAPAPAHKPSASPKPAPTDSCLHVPPVPLQSCTAAG